MATIHFDYFTFEMSFYEREIGRLEKAVEAEPTDQVAWNALRRYWYRRDVMLDTFETIFPDHELIKLPDNGWQVLRDGVPVEIEELV